MIKNILKKVRDGIYRILLKPFGKYYINENFSLQYLLKLAFVQKILGFNRNVPWPVHWTTQVKAYTNIDHGNRCPGISRFCNLDGRNGIKIGKNVWVGPRVSIISMNHDTANYNCYTKEGPIVIGDNCWLGTGCIILPNVKLGNHVVIAAGSIVTKSFEDDNIVLAGNPAKIVKNLDKYNDNFKLC